MDYADAGSGNPTNVQQMTENKLVGISFPLLYFYIQKKNPALFLAYQIWIN